MKMAAIAKKRKRVKVRCLVCKSVFDDDYQTTHNTKFHASLITKNKNLPYESVGAEKNPFAWAEAKKKKSNKDGANNSKVSWHWYLLTKDLALPR